MWKLVMWRLVAGILFFGLVLSGISAALAVQPLPLKFNGQPVEFAFWSPRAPSITYDQVALAPERGARFAEESVGTLYGLYRAAIHFRADGDVDESNLIVRHVLSQSAIRNHGNAGVWVDAFSEIASINEAYTLHPDGRRVPVDPGTIQLTATDDNDIFTDSFKMVLPFPDLKVGSATVLAVHRRHRREAYLLPWSRIFYPQTLSYRERFEVRVSWDRGVEPPKWKTDFPALECREDGPRLLLCQAERIEPHPDDPNIIYVDVLPTLVIAEPTSWSALAQRVSALVEGAYTGNPDLDTLLAEILQGATTEDQRLERIHRFVSQDIRYLGLEHGFGGLVPRPTDLTLRRRFGDCKDKAVLFVDLARRAGFEAYPALASTKRENLDKLLLPASGYFNHMVACVRVEQDRKERCLDLTDPLSSHEYLSRGVQGSIRLDIAAATTGPGRLPMDEFTWVLEVTAENDLNADGSLDERLVRTYGAANAAWLRGKLQSSTRRERLGWLREDYENLYSSEMTLDKIDYRGIDEVVSEVVISSRARLAKSFNPDQFTYYEEWENWMISEANNFTSENETHAYSFPGLLYRGENRYHLPPTLRIAHSGARIDFSSAFGTYTRRYQIDDRNLVVITELAMPRATIAADRIPEFNRFIAQVRDNAQINFDVEAVAAES